jgi:hypothetical protein
MLEIPVRLLVEGYYYCHDFTQAQGSTPMAFLGSFGEEGFLPLGFKLFTPIIDLAEQFF